jgi:hypothetical protein
MQHRWWLKWEEATQVLAEFTAESRSGQRMRGGDETGWRRTAALKPTGPT